MDLLLGGYRGMRRELAPYRETANGRLFSIESAVGEISTDGQNWRPFEKALWRKSSDGSEAFAGWWELSRQGEKSSVECMFDAVLGR